MDLFKDLFDFDGNGVVTSDEEAMAFILLDESNVHQESNHRNNDETE